MKTKKTGKVSETLLYLLAVESLLIDAIRPPHEWLKRQKGWDDSASRSLIYYLIKKGLILIEEKADKKFIKLTRKGVLEALFSKSKVKNRVEWDGKWRIVIFDIPETARRTRNKLRELLKDAGFIKLQASVFISPHPLNKAGVMYLKETGLTEYIRFLRVEEMDDDSDMRRVFKV